MFKQQFLFSLLLIFSGILTGWFSHSAFISIFDQDDSQEVVSPTNVIAVTRNHEAETLNAEKDSFTELLASGRYEQALLVFKNKNNPEDPTGENKEYYRQILFQEINQLRQQSRIEQVQELLSVFVKEYYNNVDLLIMQGQISEQAGQFESAIISYYQAKNFATDNKQLSEVSQGIYKLAHHIHKQIEASTDWTRGIKLFEQFISYETEYAFFHFVLADFYIRRNNYAQAISHLNLLADDPEFGQQAAEMLHNLYFNEPQSGIELKRRNEHYVVDTLLSETFQVELLIDTGASLTILSPELISRLEQLGLARKMGNNQLHTAAGQLSADIYQVSALSIGKYTVENITVAELKLESANPGQNNIDGLLGMSFLKQFNFTIDQENDLLLLTPK